MTFAEKIATIPMLKVLLPIVAGIAAARWQEAPVLPLACSLAAVWALAWLRCGKRFGSLYCLAALFLLAMLITQATAPRAALPAGEKLHMLIQVAGQPAIKGKWAEYDARVGGYRLYGSETWQTCLEKVLLRADTSSLYGMGDRFACDGYVNPFGTSAGGYGTLMRNRGYVGTLYLPPWSRTIPLPPGERGLRYAAAAVRTAAAERLGRLSLAPDQAALCSAMTIGIRDGFQPALRQAYSRAGTSHLLAVSGLHVGIVFLLINLAIGLLPLFPYGHVVKNLAAILCIWGYALLCGLPPSVVRAATMFTGAQLALAGSLTNRAANMLFGAGAVMLALRPAFLGDISFQLSFLAVAAIMVAFGPLYRQVHSRNALLNAVWSVIIVGLAASLGTAPLVSHQFGNLPLLGIVLNPVVILTANVIVLGSLLWILLPLGWLNGLFSTMLGAAADLQNTVVMRCAGLDAAALDIRLSAPITAFCYLTLGIIALYLIFRKEQPEPIRPLP